MSYLLDTCIISDLRKAVPTQARAWFESRNQESFYLSVVTLAELLDGIERLPSSHKRKELEKWYHYEVQQHFKRHILSIDDRVAKEWGLLNANLNKKGLCVGVQDLYIGATARIFSLTLVTRNKKDFQAMDIPLVDPWE